MRRVLQEEVDGLQKQVRQERRKLFGVCLEWEAAADEGLRACFGAVADKVFDGC